MKQDFEYSDNLVRYRKSQNLSQVEMAKRLGLKNQQAYQYYENKLTMRSAAMFSEKLGYDLINNKTLEVKPDKIYAPTPSNGKRTEALLKVLLFRVARQESKETGRSVDRCIQDIYEDAFAAIM